MTEPDHTPLPSLPARPIDGHKGTFATVTIVGGRDDSDACMIGAPALAARAALRTGCGLVRLVMPRSILGDAIAIEPGATGIPVQIGPHAKPEPHAMTARIDEAVHASACLVVGPGLGTSESAQAATLRAIQQEDAPVVLDADALTIMATIDELNRELHARAILTPHPGEFRRLASALKLTQDLDSDDARASAAAALAQRLGCVVVLKGHHSVVTDGLRAWTCNRGGPWLATAGTGDALSGIIAALVAQHVAPPPIAGLSDAMRQKMPKDPLRPLDLYDAARLGVDIHARAGDSWRESHGATGGMLARELCDEVCRAVESMRDTETN